MPGIPRLFCLVMAAFFPRKELRLHVECKTLSEKSSVNQTAGQMILFGFVQRSLIHSKLLGVGSIVNLSQRKGGARAYRSSRVKRPSFILINIVSKKLSSPSASFSQQFMCPAHSLCIYIAPNFL